MKWTIVALALLSSLTSAQAQRVPLAAATTFYVDVARPDDSGNGLTLATAKKTTNAMIAVLQQDYDFRCNDVNIQHAFSGTAYGSITVSGSFVGQCGRPLRLTCVSVTRGACVINGGSSDAVFLSGHDTNVLVEGFSVQSASGAGLHSTFGATLFYRDMEFLSCIFHIQTEKLAQSFYINVRQDGVTKSNYFITAGALHHVYVNNNSTAYLTETVNGNGLQFTTCGNVFSSFVNAIMGANFTAHTNSFISLGCNNTYPNDWSQWNSTVGNVSQIPGNGTTITDASSLSIP